MCHIASGGLPRSRCFLIIKPQEDRATQGNIVAHCANGPRRTAPSLPLSTRRTRTIVCTYCYGQFSNNNSNSNDMASFRGFREKRLCNGAPKKADWFPCKLLLHGGLVLTNCRVPTLTTTPIQWWYYYHIFSGGGVFFSRKEESRPFATEEEEAGSFCLLQTTSNINQVFPR